MATSFASEAVGLRAIHQRASVVRDAEFGELHRKLGHPVRIEPGLQPSSPRNGNISNIRRRLSAISPRKWPNLESGDRPPICKNPPLAGISGITEDKISRRRTGWLATQCLIAPVSKQIPWYQGILQGILRFWGLETRFCAKKPLRCSHFSSNSLRRLSAKIFWRTANFQTVSGNDRPRKHSNGALSDS